MPNLDTDLVILRHYQPGYGWYRSIGLCFIKNYFSCAFAVIGYGQDDPISGGKVDHHSGNDIRTIVCQRQGVTGLLLTSSKWP